MGGGHLQRFIDTEGRQSEVKAAIIMQQIFRPVQYLHRNGIAHRDLKPENCLLVNTDPIERGIIKVSDLGLACFVDRRRRTLKEKIGTKTHMAPEVFAGRYNHMCDAWACGVIMFQVLTKSLPFNAQDEGKGRLSFQAENWWDTSEEAMSLV